MDILEKLELFIGEELDEKMAIRVGADEREQSRLYYNKNKGKIKMKSAKYRKTREYKKYLAKKKKWAKLGLTTTGKRIRTRN